jgi:hypothetical protein
MKHQQNYFYSNSGSIVPLSNRGYQSLDISYLVHKPAETQISLVENWKTQIKLAFFPISGFLMGGLAGQLVANNVLSEVEFGFLYIAAGLFEKLAVANYLSEILSAGFVGLFIGAIVGILSLVPVLE